MVRVLLRLILEVAVMPNVSQWSGLKPLIYVKRLELVPMYFVISATVVQFAFTIWSLAILKAH